ncbi:hypothetical protein [Streptomyces wuyuanensis]|uniref:hypothetical protein n=1 Tax=Streptomyces wuyuanensis TaxID=1196353 RepID=UPI003D73FEE6
MPKPRRKKQNHLVNAKVVGSKSKASVWMSERASFREKHGCSLDALKDRAEWVEVKFGDELADALAARYGVARARRTETRKVVAE